MIALTLAAGFAVLLIQQAIHELRKLASEPTGVDHATDVFPHLNETKQTYQTRKQ